MYEIMDISWNRTNLIIKLNKFINCDVYLENSKRRKIKIESLNEFININLTNTPEGKMIDKEKYSILIGEQKLILNLDLLKKLDDCSRIFKYRKDYYAAIVDFSIDNNKIFYICVDYMMQNKKYKKYLRIVEGKNIKEKILIFFKSMLIFFVNLIYNIFRFLAFNKNNKTLLLSECSDDLTDNLRCFYEKNTKTKKNKILTFNRYEKNNRSIIFQFLKELFYLSICNTVIIDNYVSMLNIIKISKKQKIIQLWHAGIGFKAVGYARFGKTGSPHPFVSSHRKYTKVFVNDSKFIDIYKEVFGVKEKIFEVKKMPRLENFLSKKNIKSIKEKLYNENEFLKNNKIILFSPTYRGDISQECYYEYDKLDLKKIFDFCKKNNFVFVVKSHPFIKNEILIDDKYKKYIFDYTNYNINELMCIADIMVTDYSSCAYEFSLLKKPIIFYRPDKKEYEYFRPIHTIDVFGKEQYEILNFNDLFEILENIKNKDSVVINEKIQ